MEKNRKYIEIVPEMYELITNSNVWSNSKASLCILISLLSIAQRGRALDLLNAGTKTRKQPRKPEDMRGH